MAGRIRSIKPEILDDEKTAALSHLEWRLFVSVWLIADDYGNFRGDPTFVMGQVLWAAGESPRSVAGALEGLQKVSLLTRYMVRGQTYFHVNGWDKHQKVSHPGKARMPGQDEADPEYKECFSESSGGPPESSGGIRESLLPDLRPPTSDLDLKSSPSARSQPSPAKPPRAAPRRALDPAWSPPRIDSILDAERAATARGVDLVFELAQMRDWAAGNAVKKADWNATWRGWIRRAKPQIASQRSWSGDPRQTEIRKTTIL